MANVKVEDLEKGKFYSRDKPQINFHRLIFEADEIANHNGNQFSVNFREVVYFKKSGAIEITHYDYEIVVKGTEYEEITEEDFKLEVMEKVEEFLKFLD